MIRDREEHSIPRRGAMSDAYAPSVLSMFKIKCTIANVAPSLYCIAWVLYILLITCQQVLTLESTVCVIFLFIHNKYNIYVLCVHSNGQFF